MLRIGRKTDHALYAAILLAYKGFYLHIPNTEQIAGLRQTVDQPVGSDPDIPDIEIVIRHEHPHVFCGKVPDQGNADQYRFLVSLFNQCYWVTGCVLGSLLGAALPFSTAGIEFSMTALFIASFTEHWISEKDHVPALTGLLGTLLCVLLFGRENFLIPSMLLITLVLTVLRRREEAG